MPYETIYAFKYSPRPFTKAARWVDQLSEEEKSDRLQCLFDKHNKIARKLAERYIGEVVEVLVEEVNNGRAYGRCDE